MGSIEESAFDPFEPVEDTGLFSALVGGGIHSGTEGQRPAAGAINHPVIGTLTGFNLEETPLVSLPAVAQGEVLEARATVDLRQQDVRSEVLVLCENGDPRKPIIVGVLKPSRVPDAPAIPSDRTTLTVDDERYVVSAEREIVLRCGDASITLTRAGKVIIKGNYVMSRATGYNKIKGAAVDIN